MKRTIQGIRYDTDKAVCIGEAVHDADDASSWQAALYRTPRSKRYFIAGSGGTMTRFNGKDKIIPLTADEATAWIHAASLLNDL